MQFARFVSGQMLSHRLVCCQIAKAAHLQQLEQFKRGDVA